MNTFHFQEAQPATDRYGHKITARLSSATDDLPYDVLERLRAARVRAVDKRKWVMLQGAPEVFIHGRSRTLSAGHGGSHGSWWSRLGLAGLALILAAGLFAINLILDEQGANELAEIDTAILTDDLPPAAYVDAGFAQFLKIGHSLDQ